MNLTSNIMYAVMCLFVTYVTFLGVGPQPRPEGSPLGPSLQVQVISGPGRDSKNMGWISIYLRAVFEFMCRSQDHARAQISVKK